MASPTEASPSSSASAAVPGKYDSPTTTIKSPQADIDAIQHSLTARRRLSLRTILRSHRPIDHTDLVKGKLKNKISDQAIDEEEDDDEVDDIENETATRINTIDWENYQKSKGDPITILKIAKDGVRRNVNVDDDNECKIDFEKEYVWDVLFENQRGIYIFGKGYFSSSGLLPADPSAFTRPSGNIPSASSLGKGKKKSSRSLQQNAADQQSDPGPSGPSFSSSNPTNSSSSSPGDNTAKSGDNKSKSKPRSNKTSYTLETHQPPLPEWEYLTPWMINMRTGTDELGWRYNSWFKKKGWSSHTGPLGWAGWVRRREWIRLRGVKAAALSEGKDGLVNTENREKVEKGGKRLKDVLKSDDLDGIVQGILVVMGKLGLDRQRLELWNTWLEDKNVKKDREVWNRFERLCQDETALNNLRKQFTYPTSSFPLFLNILSNHSIHIPTTFESDTSSSTNPSTPSSAQHQQQAIPVDEYEPFRSSKP